MRKACAFFFILLFSCDKMPKLDDHIRIEKAFQKIEFDMTREEVEQYFEDWEIVDPDETDFSSSGTSYTITTKSLSLSFRYFLRNKTERLISLRGLYTDKNKKEWYISLKEKKWLPVN